MKQLINLVFLFFSLFFYAQNYPFATEFTSGKVILKDSSEISGQIKWYPSQNDKLRFKKNENENPVKYNPDDVISFSSGDLKFVPLYNFQAYADNYALIGTPTKIENTFGEVISEGKFNVYLTSIRGYNAISRTAEDYLNFVFLDTSDPDKKLYAYPYVIRMKEKKYEKAKENLYVLFKDYPEIVEKIRAFKKENNFLQIIDMISNINTKKN
ncbi:hypothetical protein EG349_05490 [Chryseobacterium shandongense]|uniref:Uncharacterized protein n=1 Tax=Chryseobacterium shandongense TaxID=1493872 RepID=A0AAD0YD32_9FLAO|nr:hypothetical protein [Chryseobacterium shandongense]AZA86277.1 hypothetical protein EG349_05490 [Chryseobacterium shandongense]AZA94687.1 hypothetical protein EG353_03510 [Chryseobacterium shandongense]